MNSSREDYLLSIYRLNKKGTKVTSIMLSKELEVSRASVSEMIKKLVQEDLVNYIDNIITLTEKGENKAKTIISSHRLWEIFLVDYLHMTPQEAHEQAHLLEHVTGENLQEALNQFLNFPTESPKGNAIWENFPGEKADQ